MSKTASLLLASLLLAAPAMALEAGSPPVPAAVTALAGCWHGEGTVMGKKVGIDLTGRPVALDAMFAIDADSAALDDKADRYAAHLLFGAGSGTDGNAISGFWSDSFGGTFTATGSGSAQEGGFNMEYRYPDNLFVNRWRRDGDRLEWQIIARSDAGKEAPFAAYKLKRVACPKA